MTKHTVGIILLSPLICILVIAMCMLMYLLVIAAGWYGIIVMVAFLLALVGGYLTGDK